MIEYYKNLSLEPIHYTNQFGQPCVEQWKSVVEYEGIYEVSNLGRFKRCYRILFIEGKGSGRGFRKFPEKIMSQYINEDGYLALGFTKDKKQTVLLSHRIVAMAFIKNEKQKPYVNHKNCDKKDNIVNNLEWSTVLENNRHSWENNRNKRMRGELNGTSKLKSSDIFEIRFLYSEKKLSPKEISDLFNISKSHVCRIARKQAWKHLG